MTKYREILRLKSLGYSERNIALCCSVSRNTVAKVCARAKEWGITWPLAPDQTDKVLSNDRLGMKDLWQMPLWIESSILYIKINIVSKNLAKDVFMREIYGLSPTKREEIITFQEQVVPVCPDWCFHCSGQAAPPQRYLLCNFDEPDTTLTHGA